MAIPFVLIDQDDTLGDLAGKVHDIFGTTYGLKVPEFQLRNFYDMLNTIPGLTAEILEDVLHLPELFAGLVPNPGAIEALQEMDKMGIEARIVTKPIFTNFTCVPEKKRWIQEHFGNAWLKRMIFTEDKTIIMGRYLVDDKPVITGSNDTPMWEHVVFNQPYNVTSPGLRLNNWSEWKEVLGVTNPNVSIIL